MAIVQYNITHYTTLFTAHIPFVPHFINQPNDVSATAPFSAVFTCSAGKCGHLNITWYRREGPLPFKSVSTEVSSPTVTTSKLVISNVTNEDVGKYYCIARATRQASWSNEATLYYTGMCNENDQCYEKQFVTIILIG